jgi:hypothetical protein
MKRCPKCSRTFPDENQKFCTFDGGLLRVDQPAFDPNLTVRATSKELLESQQNTDVDSSEAQTSVRLRSLNETITSFGTTTFKETSSVNAPTAPDLITPPQAAESAPTSLDLSAHAPVMAPPAQNVPPAPAASAAAVAATTTISEAPPKKKSMMPLILGLLIALLLLGGGAAVAGYLLVLKPMLAKQGGTTLEPTNPNPGPSPADSTSPANTNTPVETKKEPAPFVPPANVIQFTNSAADLDGDLAAHYVGFSFYYPSTWTKDPKSGVRGASSFVILNSQSSDQTGDYLQERVIFNWYPSKGTYEADVNVFPQSAKKITDQLAKGLPNYEEVSRGETTVNTYKGYEVRFKGVFNDAGKGDLPYWGRVIFLPPGSQTEKGGPAIVMLATSKAQDVTGAADVGNQGGMALILDSFRFTSR